MLLILADDFTGALDTGVQLAKRGITTRVAITRSPQVLETQCQVLVVDAETRHCSPREALDCFRRLSAAAREAEVPCIYHKVDSTFRGNVGAQTEGIVKGFGAARVAVVPAYPALGRTVQGQHIYLDGVPLERTAFARDPFNPVHTGSIPELLAGQTGLPVFPGTEWGQQGSGLFVFDAQTGEDLGRIAQTLAAGQCRVVVGCAGFAEYLDQFFPFQRGAAPVWEGARRCLLLCGSVHPNSQRQLALAQQAGDAVFHLSEEMKRAADLWALPAAEALAEQAKAALAQGFVAVTAGEFSGPREALSPEEDAARVAGNLACIAQRLMDEKEPPTLAVFGGDTAVALMRALGAQTLEPVGELCPGVPYSFLHAGGRRYSLITKAGGFGSPDMVAQLKAFVRRGRTDGNV